MLSQLKLKLDYAKPEFPPHGYKPSPTSEVSVPELQHWIMGRRFLAEYYDVTVHLTLALLGIECHNSCGVAEVGCKEREAAKLSAAAFWVYLFYLTIARYVTIPTQRN